MWVDRILFIGMLVFAGLFLATFFRNWLWYRQTVAEAERYETWLKSVDFEKLTPEEQEVALRRIEEMLRNGP